MRHYAARPPPADAVPAALVITEDATPQSVITFITPRCIFRLLPATPPFHQRRLPPPITADATTPHFHRSAE